MNLDLALMKFNGVPEVRAQSVALVWAWFARVPVRQIPSTRPT